MFCWEFSGRSRFLSSCYIVINEGHSEADLEVRQTTAWDYLLRKTKLKAIFALLHGCSPYLKSASGSWVGLDKFLFSCISHSISVAS